MSYDYEIPSLFPMSALHVSHNHFMHILVENCKQWPQFLTLPGFMPWQCELCSFFQKGVLILGPGLCLALNMNRHEALTDLQGACTMGP